ncbi:MAG: hypothetical protein LBP86_02115, partial [Azoarcus sp.]|nr:hypothetical protein [Azoarcus sp.]
MKRALSLPAAFVCALGLHLAPLAAWLALTRAAPEPEKPLLSFDNIGIVALRAQEARTAEPPPPQTAPPPPASRPPPPRPAPKPPSRRAAVPLPEPPPAAAASAAPPPEAHEAKEEESRLAQRLVDQEA